MGKYEKKEKTGEIIARVLWCSLIVLVGVLCCVALRFSGWLDSLGTKLEANVVYCIGLIVVALACVVFSAIHTSIAKKKNRKNKCK